MEEKAGQTRAGQQALVDSGIVYSSRDGGSAANERWALACTKTVLVPAGWWQTSARGPSGQIQDREKGLAGRTASTSELAGRGAAEGVGGVVRWGQEQRLVPNKLFRWSK